MLKLRYNLLLLFVFFLLNNNINIANGIKAHVLDTPTKADDFIERYKMVKDHFMTADNVTNDEYNKYKVIERKIREAKIVSDEERSLYEKIKLKIEHSSILNTLFYCIIEKSDFIDDARKADLPYDSSMIRNCLLAGTKHNNKLLTRITDSKTQLGSIYTALNFLVEHNMKKQIKRMEALLEVVDDEVLMNYFKEMAYNEKEFVKLFSDNNTKRRYGISDYNIYIELADNILKRKKTNKIIAFVIGFIISLFVIWISLLHKYEVNTDAIKDQNLQNPNKNIDINRKIPNNTSSDEANFWDMMNYLENFGKENSFLGYIGKGIILFSILGSVGTTLYILINLLSPSNFYSTLSHKFDVIKAYVESIINVYNYVRNNKKLWPLFKGRFKACEMIFGKNPKLSEAQKEMLALINIIPYKWNYWLQWGSARAKYFCRFFLLFENNKSLFINPMMEVSNFESYLCSARLLKSSDKKKNKWSIVRIKDKASHPFLKLDKVWAPVIDNDKAINNDIHFSEDVNDKIRMAILFGMNAGGKTTLIQSIASSLLLAHVYGICPAEKCTLTPFKKIFIVIDVTTDIEKNQSKFMSELIACDNIIEDNKILKGSNFGFLICDELFCGTNPSDSNFFATNFICHMCANRNIVGIYATHDEGITEFAERFPNVYFVNYHMKVKDDINELKYYYKIERGIIKQQIALALAADMGRRGLLKNADILLGEMFKKSNMESIKK